MGRRDVTVIMDVNKCGRNCGASRQGDLCTAGHAVAAAAAVAVTAAAATAAAATAASAAATEPTPRPNLSPTPSTPRIVPDPARAHPAQHCHWPGPTYPPHPAEASASASTDPPRQAI